jgi:hypothetical protein
VEFWKQASNDDVDSGHKAYARCHEYFANELRAGNHCESVVVAVNRGAELKPHMDRQNSGAENPNPASPASAGVQ